MGNFFVFWKLHSKSTWLKSWAPSLWMGMTPLVWMLMQFTYFSVLFLIHLWSCHKFWQNVKKGVWIFCKALLLLFYYIFLSFFIYISYFYYIILSFYHSIILSIHRSIVLSIVLSSVYCSMVSCSILFYHSIMFFVVLSLYHSIYESF